MLEITMSQDKKPIPFRDLILGWPDGKPLTFNYPSGPVELSAEDIRQLKAEFAPQAGKGPAN